MRNSDKFKKLFATIGAVAFCSALVLATPVTTISAEAAVKPSDSVQHDYIGYNYVVENNKIYKCLYNFSTGEQLGPWIYVRDL